MKLVNVSKKGTLKFELSDGRFITSYNSGYVRINGNDRLYQMNKKVKIYTGKRFFGVDDYYYKRILIMCAQERYEFIKRFVARNITN